MTEPMTPEREQQIPAEVHLAQYTEQAPWSNPTYGHGNEQALHRVALELQAELTRLRRESEERLGELLFWHVEYREAMDNYKGEAQHAKKLSAELEDTARFRDSYARSAAHIAAKRDHAEALIASWESGDLPAYEALQAIKQALAVGPVAAPAAGETSR